METRKVIYTTGFKAGSLNAKKGIDKAKIWVDYRFEFWKRYTLNSILNQENSSWEYWFIVDEVSYDLLDGRFDAIEDERVKLVFRHDQAKAGAELEGHDYYIVFRLDSDDMYRYDVTDEMMYMEIADTTGLFKYVQYTHGYIYKARTKQLKEWWRKHMSPPFFARIYSYNEWWRMIDSGELELFDGGHEQVRLHKRRLLAPGKFCVGVQDMNMVTTLGKRTEILDEDEKKEILSGFGVDYPESDFLDSEHHDPWGLLPGGWKE
jgi:hypothetical protein